MVELNASAVDCLVFTFKEGLLSRVAHDLRIRVTSLTLRVGAAAAGEPSISATFDARSLRVETAMKDGAADFGALSAGDRQKIEKNIVKDVLHASRHPEVRFEGGAVRPRGDGYHVDGELTLHGRTRRLKVPVRREGERLVAEVELDQTDYGIKPYSALLGTLKVQPRLTVRLSVPAASVEPA